MLAKVTGDLLIGIAHQANEELLGQKLGCAPIQMEVDAVLILRILILEIVGEAGDSRKFTTGLRIEVGIAATAVDGSVTDAEIGEADRALRPNGNIARHIGHEIVDASVPLESRLRIEVADRRDRIAKTARARYRQRTDCRRQRPVKICARPPEQSGYADGELPVQHRRCKRVSRIEQYEIRLCVQMQVQINVHRGGDPAYLDFPGGRGIAEGTYTRVIINFCHRPAGDLRGRRKAAEAAREPV